MIGKLHKTEKGWVVIYSDYDFTGMPCVGMEMLLHPKCQGIGYMRDHNKLEGSDIEFEIVEEPIYNNDKFALTAPYI